MPKVVENALTAVRVKQEKRPGRYADGNGLLLHVTATGARFFEWRGTVAGKRVLYGIGPVRLTTLATARETAREWSRIARDGGDPRQVRDAGKRRALTFKDAAEKCHADRIAGNVRNAKHEAQWISTLRTYAKALDHKPIDQITQPDVIAVLKPIWLTIPETARRVRQRLATVFDWAIAHQHREGANPVPGVEKALPAQRRAASVRHHESLDWQELPTLWPRLVAAEGIGADALRFTILTAARSGEVRGATWSEIDLDERRWTVPADRMKAHRPHAVPLSDAAVAVLERMRPLAPLSPAGLIFPSTVRTKNKAAGGPLSDMTLAAVLKRLEVPVTVHGFRSTFRTWAEESTAYPRAVIETALAHSAAENAVEAAYLRSDLFKRRVALMDDWAALVTGG